MDSIPLGVSPKKSSKKVKKRISADLKSKIRGSRAKVQRSKSVEPPSLQQGQESEENLLKSTEAIVSSEQSFKNKQYTVEMMPALRPIPLKSYRSDNSPEIISPKRKNTMPCSSSRRKRNSLGDVSPGKKLRMNQAIPVLPLTDMRGLGTEDNGDIFVNILKEKLPWFGALWDEETENKQQEILDALHEASSGKSKSERILRPKVSFRAPGGPSLEKFGSRRDMAQVILGVIELSKNTSAYVEALIDLSNSIQIHEKVNNTWKKDLFDMVINDVLNVLKERLKSKKPIPHLTKTHQYLITQRDEFLTILDNTQNDKFGSEISAAMCSIISDVKSVIRELIIKTKVLLEDICIMLLKHRAKQEEDKVFLFASSKCFIECLISLAENATRLTRYNMLIEEKLTSSPKRIAASLSRTAKSNPDVTSVFKPEDRSNWPQGAISMNGLVYDIAVAEDYNSDHLKAFISTHQAFISSDNLLRLLVGCYYASESYGEKKNAIQLRICIALKYWIEVHISDFRDELLKNLLAFVENEIMKDHQEMSVLLQRIIKNKMETTKSENSMKIESISQLIDIDRLRTSSILDMLGTQSPTQIATQLTLIDWEIFGNIKNFGLLKCAWDKSSLKHRSIPVIRCMTRLNSISHWTATMILLHTEAQRRADMIRIFLTICEELLKLNNFNSLAAIIVSLDMVSVSRLKQSFSLLGKRATKTLQDFQTMLNPVGSFKQYRKVLKHTGSPLIPYFGVYLSDLMFIDQGNPDSFDNGLINFDKQSLVYKSIKEITQFQNHEYSLNKQEPLYSSLLGLPFFDSDSLYHLSLLREPKKPPLTE